MTAPTGRRKAWRPIAGLAALAAQGLPGPGLGRAARAQATPAGSTDEAFWFGFIGDTPYNPLEEDRLAKVVDALNAQALRFVLHVGDFKSSSEACSDALFAHRFAQLERLAHPLVYTPGDNEWTDCHGEQPDAIGGRSDRLRWLRRHAFGRDASLGGRPMPLERQAGGSDGTVVPGRGLPENLRWRIGSLQFCTLHVVGSDNGLANRGPLSRRQVEEEWSLRQEANGQWLLDTVRLARRDGARGLVVALHANLRFGRQREDGLRPMRELLLAATGAFAGPIALLHGDTHQFRTEWLVAPSPATGGLLRIECFGSPFASSWVQIRWDPQRIGTPEGPFLVATRNL